MSRYVIIDDQYFSVSEDQAQAVRVRLIEAVRTGGDFITFGGGNGARQVEILVTPLTSVRIERVEEPEASEDFDDSDARAAAALIDDW